jgi:hypothetical protein
MRFLRRFRPGRAVKLAYHTRIRLEMLQDRCVSNIDTVANLSGSGIFFVVACLKRPVGLLGKVDETLDGLHLCGAMPLPIAFTP